MVDATVDHPGVAADPDAARPDVTTYNSLLNACAKAAKCDEALAIFETMEREDDVPPDVVTYSTLITACTKAGQCEKALEICEAMVRDGLRPNRVVLNAWISACASSGNWEEAWSVFQTMMDADSTRIAFAPLEFVHSSPIRSTPVFANSSLSA